jgi:hypothetical protein
MQLNIRIRVRLGVERAPYIKCTVQCRAYVQLGNGRSRQLTKLHNYITGILNFGL